jgi:glucan 1,4-alpha-glucosidase
MIQKSSKKLGVYLTIAWNEKGSANWNIGVITDENSPLASIPLQFLDKDKKYVATIL